jgi:hypothetical protein
MMSELNLRSKAVLVGSVITLGLGGSALLFLQSLEESGFQVRQGTSQHTLIAAQRVTQSSSTGITGIWRTGLLSTTGHSKEKVRAIDSSLSVLCRNDLAFFNDIEGGFYFIGIDEFLGFS